MPRRTRRTPASPRDGLTLVEVAVSVAILGGVIAGILVARARAFAAQHTAESMMTCVRLCAGKTAEFRAGLAAVGEGDFDCPKGYRWTIRAAALPDSVPRNLAAFEVRVFPTNAEDIGVTAPVWICREEKKAK